MNKSIVLWSLHPAPAWLEFVPTVRVLVARDCETAKRQVAAEAIELVLVDVRDAAAAAAVGRWMSEASAPAFLLLSENVALDSSASLLRAGALGALRVDDPPAFCRAQLLRSIQLAATLRVVDANACLSLDQLERRHILHVLESLHGNKTLAAQRLGLDRTTLYRKLERYAAEERLRSGQVRAAS